MKLLLVLFGVALLMLLGCAGQNAKTAGKGGTKSIQISDSDLDVKSNPDQNLDNLAVPDLSADQIQDSDLMVDEESGGNNLDDLTTASEPA